MSVPSAGELALLRTQPHQTRLHLSIFKPKVVFAAQVNNGSIAKGEQVIDYNNQAGTPNYGTLYAGSTPTGTDLGSIYVFDFDDTAKTVTVGENSHILWQDDIYIMIKDFRQIWPWYPRYVQSGGDITVYKAYNIAYTDENENLGTLLCMGPHFAGFRDPNTGQAQVYYDATGSENLDGSALTYFWEFDGGSPPTGTGITPGYVDYSTPGHYSTRLTISAANGAQDSAIRHVSIYDRPGEGPNTPILQWDLESLTGSRDEGGYTARITVHGEGIDDIEDGALVIIFADDWYGSTEQSIGGNATNRENTVFVGYILDGTIEYNYERGTVSFEVGSPTEVMKRAEAFSVSVESSSDPVADAANPDKGGDPWFYHKDLTVKKALYHYLRWHSMVNICADLQYSGTDFNIQYFDADRNSLFDAISTFLENTTQGSIVSDRQGKIWFEIDVSAIDNAASSVTQNMFVDRHDWMGAPLITERLTPGVSYLEVGGVAYSNPSTGTSTALLGAAPGSVPGYRGSFQKRSGFALTGQSQLNTLVGNIYAYQNSRYPEVSLQIVGNYRNFDLAPQELIRLTVAPDDTPKGISWTNKPFAVRGLDWIYDSQLQLLRPELVVSEVTQGFDGDTISIPVIPPDKGFTQPPPGVPPIPTPIPIPTLGRYVTINFVLTDGGSVLTNKVYGDLKANFAGRIDGAYLYADQSGSVAVDVWLTDHAGFPPTVADSICGASYPTLSTAQKYADTTLSGWTRYFLSGSVFTFQVRSSPTPASVTRVTIALQVWRD